MTWNYTHSDFIFHRDISIVPSLFLTSATIWIRANFITNLTLLCNIYITITNNFVIAKRWYVILRLLEMVGKLILLIWTSH